MGADKLMVRYNWNNLILADYDDGSPNQGLIWGTLWAQNRAFRKEQQLAMLGTTSSNVTGGFSVPPMSTPKLVEKVFIPVGTEEISFVIFGRSGGGSPSTTTYKLRVTLWLDGSNEWPLLWGPDDSVRGQERTSMESDELLPFNVGIGSNYNHASYEGPGLPTDVIGIDQDEDPDLDVSTDTIASFLPAEFEVRLDAKREAGTSTGTFQIRAILLQQKGAYYQHTREETLFITAP